MRLTGIAVVLFVAALHGLLWVNANRPLKPEEAHYPFESLSLNPYQRNQSPFRNDHPTLEQIDHDLKILSAKTKSVRIYSSLERGKEIIQLAKDHELKVIVSAWLDADVEKNKREVEAAIQLAGRNHHVTRLILGNESQLSRMVPRDELISYLVEARKRLKTPVSTAEPWDFWLNNPELVDSVDFIAIHVLPYWVDVHVDQSIEYVLSKYNAVKEAYPNKFVLLAETGWPSDGPQRGAAEATLENQARFVREFIERAEVDNIPYNLVEAFDQPWKSAIEGRAGEHWGIMDAERAEKFPIKGPVLEHPQWRYWAGTAVLAGFLSSLIFMLRQRGLKIRGQLVATIALHSTAGVAALIALQAAGEYLSLKDITFWAFMLAAQSLLAVILLSEAAEIASVVGAKPLKRRFSPFVKGTERSLPFVSLHVACCKEPPHMVIATIDSLANLDYPNFEVVVVDNNTQDEDLWRPVEARCKELGQNFRFYSLGRWPGYKAGALNFALSVTDARAKIVGVIDADYVVEPNWLLACVPYFADSGVALVQAPQEHRAWENSVFQRLENDEYSGFFRIGMVQRNEDNAIVQHGTMTLICRKTLDEVGAWAEWCICEDAELGLRLLSKGKKSVYLDHTFGRGLVPDSFEAYAKQRFRWAYGGMRIMRHYWRELLGIRGELTPAQRYQFVKGWLPWVGDALHLGVTLSALAWSARLIWLPLETDFPEPVFIFPAIALVLVRIVGTLWTYRSRVNIGRMRTFLAMLAGSSLTHTVAKAVYQGLFTSQHPFFRTPKLDKAPRLLKSLVFARQEIVLGLALVTSAAGVLAVFGTINDTAVLWAFGLVTQAIPYGATAFVAILSCVDTPLKKDDPVPINIKYSGLTPQANL